MKVALAGTPENIMSRPNGLVDRLIDRNTGEIARPGQANTTFEVFMAETAPADNSRRPADTSRRNNDESLSTEIIF